MNLLDLIHRTPPQPWEGDNIPWSEPGFSQRMLKIHLSQASDAASRRTPLIEKHINFIYERALGSQPGRVLDLGCGPGLYSYRLARLGCEVTGIDYSPASIDYARQIAEAESCACTYHLADIRTADYGPAASYDLAMLIFGEFTVFKPADAALILNKCAAALRPGGKVILEPSKAHAIRKEGESGGRTWVAEAAGLFSDRPHLVLEELGWDDTRQVLTHRYYVVDAETGAVQHFSASYQAYREEALRKMIEEAGFRDVQIFPSLTGEDDGSDFMAIIATRA